MRVRASDADSPGWAGATWAAHSPRDPRNTHSHSHRSLIRFRRRCSAAWCREAYAELVVRPPAWPESPERDGAAGAGATGARPDGVGTAAVDAGGAAVLLGPATAPVPPAALACACGST